MEMDNRKKTIYYFSSTHWDREWCQSFQGFRNRLVTMMNEMIEVMEQNPNFRLFHLDGQTVMLEDYLEIEPDRKWRLAELIGDQRLLIGPWYVMPDELLLSGESLIRNLMTGARICRDWDTTPWKYGYVCDMFGHIAQMPQIFNGFDIHYAVLGRGTNEHTHQAHLRWRSPDGSECITFKLNDLGGYSSFSFGVGYEMEQKNLSIREIEPLVKSLIDYELARSPVPITVIMDGMDHQPIRKATPEIIELIRRLYPDAEVKHVNLEEMGRQLESYRDQLPIHQGEIYDTAKASVPYNHVIRHTLSSRYPLKKANDEIQCLLEKWAEPLAALADLKGYSVQPSYVNLAYKHLLLNHPHDSICGCSIDQVHKDMEYRFDQARMLGENVVSDIMAFEKAVYRIDKTSRNLLLAIWNPLPYPRKEVATLDIDFPLQYPSRYSEPFGYESINSFKIYDAGEKEIPYGLKSIRKNHVVKVYNQTGTETVDRYTLSMEIELPAMGKAEYSIVPFSASSRYLDRLSQHESEAENESIKLKINPNGTLRITDKRSNKVYDNMLSYMDDGEIGDGWYHANPAEDRLISSLGSECRIERVENGPSRTVFRITHRMMVPESMNWDSHGIRRSEELVPLQIISQIGLSRGASCVDVESKIVNRAKDHRLRLKLPAGIEGNHYFVNQPFAFVERKTGIDLTTQEWREYDVPEKQMGGIVGKRAADGTGLAFVSAYGLHECSALDDEEQTITVTMFRGFRTTIMTNGEEGGQIVGDLQFKYCLALMEADTSFADLAKLQERLQTNVYAAAWPIEETYKPEDPVSYFELSESSICMSVIKRPENRKKNSVVVRLYNMSDKHDACRLTCFKEIAEAHILGLDEDIIASYPHHEKSLDVQLAPWKIMTYQLIFK
ncbi:glycoside hydrolase family 38 C-terminal domain-containing protein [Paenibacillus montanisoli]|nr:glycoside hydrolase family 38 C-terminal domain-containing protein [Paenibacillus montanisoli]